MADTARAWSEQQANTVFDTGNDAFERFGLTLDSFGGIEASKDWLTRLNTTWTDGQAGNLRNRQVLYGRVQGGQRPASAGN